MHSTGQLVLGRIRRRTTAVLVVLATASAGVLVGLGAAPAQAGWSQVGNGVHLRVCRQATDGGWIFLTRARKVAGVPDARASVAVRLDGVRQQGWSSGWLQGRRGERGWVRVARDGRVRLVIRQEAGERGSDIGTAKQRQLVRPRDVARCG